MPALVICMIAALVSAFASTTGTLAAARPNGRAAGLERTGNVDQYAPSSDATRVLLRRPRDTIAGVHLRVIDNWPTLLKTTGDATAPATGSNRK
jgi:hypothetical protein